MYFWVRNPKLNTYYVESTTRKVNFLAPTGWIDAWAGPGILLMHSGHCTTFKISELLYCFVFFVHYMISDSPGEGFKAIPKSRFLTKINMSAVCSWQLGVVVVSALLCICTETRKEKEGKWGGRIGWGGSGSRNCLVRIENWNWCSATETFMSKTPRIMLLSSKAWKRLNADEDEPRKCVPQFGIPGQNVVKKVVSSITSVNTDLSLG